MTRACVSNGSVLQRHQIVEPPRELVEPLTPHPVSQPLPVAPAEPLVPHPVSPALQPVSRPPPVGPLAPHPVSCTTPRIGTPTDITSLAACLPTGGTSRAAPHIATAWNLPYPANLPHRTPVSHHRRNLPHRTSYRGPHLPRRTPTGGTSHVAHMQSYKPTTQSQTRDQCSEYVLVHAVYCLHWSRFADNTGTVCSPNTVEANARFPGSDDPHLANDVFHSLLVEVDLMTAPKKACNGRIRCLGEFRFLFARRESSIPCFDTSQDARSMSGLVTRSGKQCPCHILPRRLNLVVAGQALLP